MITLVAGIQSSDRGIGKNNDLLYNFSEDMEHFKNVTKGKTVIMGRKTWESIPEKFRPLPHRENIIITRNKNYEAPGAIVSHSLEEGLIKAFQLKPESEIFIIGGGQLYSEAIRHPKCTKLELSIFEGQRDADVFFPKYENEFTEIEREEYAFTDRIKNEDVKVSFVTFQRK